MTFVHKSITPVELEQINGLLEGRKYRDPQGRCYPSVTTVLGNLPGTDKSWIAEWHARIGKEAADGILVQAGNRGAAIHDMAEKFLLGQDWKKGQMPVNKATMLTILPFLERISRIVCLEMRMMSHVLRVAGTVDCIACFDGVPSVIDFKTSRQMKTKDDIHHYFMQASIYSLMFEELTGVKVNQIVIIMASDVSSEGLLFVEDRKRWLKEFILLRKQLPDWPTVETV